MPVAQGQNGGLGGMLVPMILIAGMFIFMTIIPQRRKEKERREMLDAIKKGDKVLFSGGIVATVASVKEKTYVLKVADNTKVEATKGSVFAVVKDGDLPEDPTPGV